MNGNKIGTVTYLRWKRIIGDCPYFMATALGVLLAMTAMTEGKAQAAPSAGEANAARKFIVHEWGVQVRSMANVKPLLESFPGRAEPNGPRSALVPPAEMIGDLPNFVIRHGGAYKPTPQYRNWNKPVIHLYGPPGLKVEIQVRTALGNPTAYWPKPSLIEQTYWRMGSGVTTAIGMAWSGRLLSEPDAKAAPAKVDDKHWWSTVRKVPGAYLQTDNGTERFVFYEGTAAQDPAITAKIISGAVRGKRSGDALQIANSHSAASGPVLVILNDLAARHFVVVDSVPATGAKSVEIEKDDLLKAGGDEKKLLAACEAQWKSFGMTDAESRAIVGTWKEDILERPGFLIIARLPTAKYDEMFPLTVSPRPDELVRVGMVFDTLAGQGERLAWAPALKAQMEKWGRELSSDDYAVRQKASSGLAQMEDMAKDLLEKLSQSGDAETQSRATALLGQLQPVTIEAPLVVNGRPSTMPSGR